MLVMKRMTITPLATRFNYYKFISKPRETKARGKKRRLRNFMHESRNVTAHDNKNRLIGHDINVIWS